MRARRCADGWDEGKVFERLGAVFPSGAYVLLPQVRNGTGCSRAQTRTADALAVSAWPSRGLHFTGVEIKVSPNDWRRELANAEKSCEIQKFCRYWYIAAPEGIVPVTELPETWGLIECSGATAKIIKQAPQLECQPADMPFVCAVLRAAMAGVVPTAAVQSKVDEAVEKELKRQQRNNDFALHELREKIGAFEKSSGINLNSRWDAGEIGEAVSFVRNSGVLGAVSVAERLRDEDARVAKRMDEAIEELRLNSPQAQPDGEHAPS